MLRRPGDHKEKAQGIISGNVFIPGFGIAYTEDLVEIMARLREKEAKEAPTEASRKEEAAVRWRAALSDRLQAKAEWAKRNPREAAQADPYRTQNTTDRKKVF